MVAPFEPPKSPSRPSQFGPALAERRESLGYTTQGQAAEAALNLARTDPHRFESFSQQWLSRLEADSSGERIDAANRRKLRTLAHLLRWTSSQFETHVGVPIGAVPGFPGLARVSQAGQSNQDVVQVPVFRNLDDGIRSLAENVAPDGYQSLLLDHLPARGDPQHLYQTYVGNHTVCDETVRQLLPVGAWLLVDAQARPAPGQLFVAYLPDHDLAVIVRHHEPQANRLLRSHRDGGPICWLADQSEVRVEGVVRRVSYDPS